MKRPKRVEISLLLSLVFFTHGSTPALDVGTGRLLALDSDIAEVQERWRQYRNLVTDGFFLNDSMIVLADYSTEEVEEEGEKNFKKEELGIYVGKNDKSDNEKDNKANFSEEDLEKSSLEPGSFKETMVEMMEALADIQTKGDLMMDAIRGQRELLYSVREEVKETEERLEMVERQRREEERMVEEAERQRLLAEAKTRMVHMEKEEAEKELEEMEREREEGARRLEMVKEEVKAVLGEVEESSQEKSRWLLME